MYRNFEWFRPITLGLIINHILLVRSFGYGQVIPVLWSLVMEIRISLIFPLLMFIINKYNWKINLLFGCGLSLFYYLLANNGRTEAFSISIEYFFTLSFIIMFIIGALLAKHREELTLMINKFSMREKVLLLIGGILLYTIRFWLFPYFGNSISPFASDISVSAGVAIFIMLSLTTRISTVLKSGIIHFLGKISYSLYLYHSLILFSLLYLYYPKVPIYIIWLMGIAITIFVSVISYKYVEQPAIKLGSKLVKTINIK